MLYFCVVSKFSENIERSEERKERNKVRRETIGKFFFDLAKLSFAGLVIGWITPFSENTDISHNIFVLFSGVVFTFVFSLIGNKILK